MSKRQESEMISKGHIHNLYAIASKNGLVESGNKDDDFHCLVYRLTKKQSVKTLTEKEYFTIRGVLLRNGDRNVSNKKKKSPAKIVSNGMTAEQIKKAWAVLYEIIEYSPSSATVGERMVGAIKKILGVDAQISQPFAWLDADHGIRLIEQLKRYERSVKRAKENNEVIATESKSR